jgi:hypothetical protein
MSARMRIPSTPLGAVIIIEQPSAHKHCFKVGNVSVDARAWLLRRMSMLSTASCH